MCDEREVAPVEEITLKEFDKYEPVTCEMSAVILPGDKRCLSFFRSRANQCCRDCDLADKIEKRVNPVMRKTVADLFKNQLTQGMDYIPDTESKSSSTNVHAVIKLKGKFVQDVYDNWKRAVKFEDDFSDAILQIRGVTRGFKDDPNAKGKGTCGLVALDKKLFPQVVDDLYYEIKIIHKEESVVKELFEQLFKNIPISRSKRMRGNKE